jgi:hypothetical protein
MGCTWEEYSNLACVSIVWHISEETQKKQVAALLKRRPKFGLLLDKATSLNSICCLIVCVRFQLPEMDNPIIIFLFLIEPKVKQ